MQSDHENPITFSCELNWSRVLLQFYLLSHLRVTHSRIIIIFTVRIHEHLSQVLMNISNNLLQYSGSVVSVLSLQRAVYFGCIFSSVLIACIFLLAKHAFFYSTKYYYHRILGVCLYYYVSLITLMTFCKNIFDLLIEITFQNLWFHYVTSLPLSSQKELNLSDLSLSM